MTKYYTMKECFDACGDDDKPFVMGLYNDELTLTKKDTIKHYHPPSIEAAISDKWQIQRAEPKVLTADEIMEKFRWPRPDLIPSIIKESHQNGRLDMYQDHKPLIDYLNRLISDYKSVVDITWTARLIPIIKILRELPKP